MGDLKKRLRRHIDRLVASTVIRGSQQGESHGGLYLIDLGRRGVRPLLDWNTPEIEWYGNGGDRGLRGIATDADTLYVAASDRLLAYSPTMELLDTWQNPYLKHCQEIAIWQRTLYIVSAGYDCILGFDLDERRFHWALHVRRAGYQFGGNIFDPMSDDGPMLLEKLRLNSLYCNENGMYITGLKTGGMLHFNGAAVNMAVQLPDNTNNVRPFRDGVIFNDNEDNVLRYTGRGEGAEDRGMPVPESDREKLSMVEAIDDGIVQAGFAKGLCVINDHVVAGGSSPATITLHDLAANKTMGSVTFSNDARETIHSIAPWPY